MSKIRACTIGLSVALMLCHPVFAGDTVGTNPHDLSHKSGGGTTVAFPDVCKTPSPAGPVPIPYPNISKSTDTAKGSKKVKTDGKMPMIKGSNYSKSKSDEPSSSSSRQMNYQGYFKRMREGIKSADHLRQNGPVTPVKDYTEYSKTNPSFPMKQVEPIRRGKEWLEMKSKAEEAGLTPAEKYRTPFLQGDTEKGAFDSMGGAHQIGVEPGKVNIPTLKKEGVVR